MRQELLSQTVTRIRLIEVLTNSTISHYRIVSKIGAGGMGEVYLAQDENLDRKVALKILPSEFANDKDRMARFVREAKSASALNHPNIITIHEIGESEGTHFIATEFIDGKTLNDYATNNPLQLNTVLEIAIQVASALDDAHTAGIVHRDLKPDNVMVRTSGLVKILDFGIAKLSEPRAIAGVLNTDGEAATALKQPSTSPGMIIGTANYMSPEQAKGKEVDARTDIFSFGVVLYELIAGEPPFEGETTIERIAAIINKEPKPLSDELPGEIKKLIRKCLRKDRDERYQTIRDVLNDLKEVKQELEIQKKLERAVAPDKEQPQTQILPATTADEVIRTTTNQANPTSHAKRYWAIAIAMLLVCSIGFFAYRYLSKKSNQIESIAVMPFVNESGNADVEYLSEGMTETLINSLSQIPNLSVKARSSVFRYKGKESDSRTIGKELGVQAILNGRLIMRGEQLTLNVELIEVQNETTIWGNRYERKLSDLVKLQSDVARDVSGHLKSLSGAEETKVTKSYTTNPKALELYLKGRYLSRQFTLDGFKKGVEALNQAIAIDSKYALAYAGLSDAYFYASTIHLPPIEALPKVGEYARKALEADDSVAAAHHSMANYLANYERNNVEAKREFERALELDPHDSSIYFDYSQLLANLGASAQAIDLAQRAKLIDPQDAYVSYTLAQAFVLGGRYDEGINETETTIRLDDKNWWGYYWRGVGYSEKGMHNEAIAALQTAASIDDSPLIRGVLACALARAGRRTEAQHIIDELIVASKSKFISQSSIAMGYGGLGEKDQAFEWLEQSLQSHDEAILWIYKHPMFASLRNDPRYKELLIKLNVAK